MSYSLNSNLGGITFYEDADGNKYAVGADSVPKKLGSPTPDMYLWLSSPVDIKALMPDIYDKLTVNDFMVGAGVSTAQFYISGGYADRTTSTQVTPQISYSNSDGILRFSVNSSESYIPGGGTNVTRKVIATASHCFAVYKGTIAGIAQ